MILVLLTEKWVFAIPYVRITCVTAVLGIFGTTLIQEIKAIGRSDITLKIELIKKPIYLLIIVIAMPFGVKAIASTSIFIEVIAFLINVYPVRKFIGFDFKMHALDAVPALLMSTIMCVTIFFVGKLISNNLVCLVTQVILGGFVYIGLSIISKNESYLYLKKIIVGKVKSR